MIKLIKNRGKELSYYLFFILMIFAKGIGLDSGDRLYYILSIAACLCVGCKLILTKYKVREIAAMAVLCAIAFAAYRNSGRLGIVLSVLAVIGWKDMDRKKLFRLGTAVYGVSFVCTVAAAKFGIIGNPMVVHEKAGMELIRWGMGYSTGNVFHISYFMLTVLLCYTWGQRYNLRRLVLLMAGNFFVFLFSLSYTGVAVTAFYLLLDFYAVKRKRLSRAEKIICQFPLPLCLLFSFGAPFLLQYPLVQKLDALLQARLTFSAYYLQNQPVTLLGTRMKDVPNFWTIMDNGYVYFFMTFGIVAFVLFCAGYAVLIARYSGVGQMLKGRCCKRKAEGRTRQAEESGQRVPEEGLTELAMIFSFLLYGIAEQFISNAFMNFSLLFFGEILFGRTETETQRAAEGEPGEGRAENGGFPERTAKGKWVWTEEGGKKEGCKKEEDKKKEDKRKRGESYGKQKVRYRFPNVKRLVCGTVGLGIFAFYFIAVPEKEYISVPVASLNYVQAQSVQMQAADISGTKEGIKNQMEDCRRILESPDILAAVIRESGVGDRISPQELKAAMEYSLPVYVQNTGEYDTFRIRLLELYYDMTEEEYAGLLNGMVAHGQELLGEKYYVKDGIYAERIGKSFGDDRIEHMDKSRGYEVEKTGNIVEMEHLRDGVFYAVFGMVIVSGVWQAAVRRKDDRQSVHPGAFPPV